MDVAAGPPALVVRVMRISAPTLASRTVPMFETSAESEVAWGPSSAATPFDPATWDAVQDATSSARHDATERDTPYTSHLVLPSSFGVVAAGETFRVGVSVTNESAEAIRGVHIHVAMQHGSAASGAPKEYALADTPPTAPHAPLATRTLGAGERCTLVATHPITAAGPHALVCRVRQTHAKDDQEDWVTKYVDALTRMYQFTALPAPVAIQAAVSMSRSIVDTMHKEARMRERTYVQIQAHNVSARTVLLERAAFLPDPAQPAWEATLVSGSFPYLAPNDVYQFMLVVTPTDVDAVREATRTQLAAAPRAHAQVQVVHALGTIHVAWRTPGGEPGEVHMGPIQRTMALPGAVETAGGGRLYASLHCAESPRAWTVDKPTVLRVVVRLEVALVADTQYALSLVPQDTWHDMQWLGPSAVHLPAFRGEATVDVELLALHAGHIQSGAVALLLHSYTHGGTARTVEPPQLLRTWPCIVEGFAT